jgi:hypothetical protein
MRNFKRLLYGAGKFLFFNPRQRRLRHGAVLLVTNLFAFSGLIFTAELVLIFLGVGDVELPLTRSARDIITNLFF